MRYIVQPEDGAGRDQIGGKATALASLHTAGFPVPAWIALTPAAFDVSLGAARSRDPAEACRGGDEVATITALADIAPSREVRDELAQAVAMLCPDGHPVAVRSSACDEDGAERSFAGQLASFLDVAPRDVAARVADVWRSGFSPRIQAYRRAHGLDPLPAASAVLIQRMVPAEAAGVAFSADPVSGRRGLAVVAAAPGVGEALVSGATDGDTYGVDRAGTIQARQIAGAHPTLDDEQVLAVAALARRCERHFGLPQDIEWALAGGSLYLLQSRPITALTGARDPDGAYALWDNSNIAESYGGVTTPLTFSFARHAYSAVYRELCRLLGVDEATIEAHDDTFRRMIGLVRGRVYYSLLSWYELLALAPGFASNRRFMEQMMGVKEGLPEPLAARLASLAAPTGRARLADQMRLVRAVGGLALHELRLPRLIRRFYARLDDALAPHEPPLEVPRPDELVAHYRDLERRLLTHWDAPLVNDFFAMLFYGLLRRLCAAWCDDAAGTLQNDLISGQGGIVSTEPARRVRTLAALAARSPALSDALSAGTLDAIAKAVAREPDFAAEYQAYLEKFADRCLEELKLESPTLRDDPLPLLRAVGHLARRFQAEGVEQPTGETPDQTLRRQAEGRIRSTLARRPLHLFAFRFVLAQARARVRDRENLRFERTRVFGRVRRIFVELGRRFYALGVLDDPRDIFYLEVEEALGFVSGTATTTDLKGLVAVREAEYARYRAEEPPPDRFETRGTVSVGPLAPRRSPVAGASPAEDGDARRSGIGCCPGVVRGPVRVVTDPKTAEVRTGEILVAERTDPGWILLFAAAAGVVVERGSLLSHSAIVARELGIPAAVSVPGVTSWLRSGDWIELDGGSGTITKRAPPAPALVADRAREEASHV
jgi:phosphohistidine swiveling domain-containing protein